MRFFKATCFQNVTIGIFLAIVLGFSILIAQEDELSDNTGSVVGNKSSETTFNTNPTHRLISPRKGQSEEQQLQDQAECYQWTCEELDWDPYQAYAQLVDEGYAVALSRRDMEQGLLCLAAQGAVFGAMSDDISDSQGNGAEIGATIAIASGIIHSSYLLKPESPQTLKIISRYERELKKWEIKYSGCMKRKYYKVTSQH